MQLQFLALEGIIFKAVERLQFLTRVELFFQDLQFFPAVWDPSKGSRRANYLILYFEEIRMFQACACGEYSCME